MASLSVCQDDLNCPICLDLLKDPVTIPCGHSFCLKCITGCWEDDQKAAYSCPQCRETFTPRPILRRNTVMADMLEKLQKTEPQSHAISYARQDVECDFCTEEKNKAIKSCLTCMGSYCEVHIQPHYEVACLKRHILVNVTQIQERICLQHNKIIEVFCRSDEELICILCSMDDHDGHKTVSAIAERIEKQKSLLEMKEENLEQIQEKERQLEEVKQTLESLQASAQEAVEETERIFTELINFMEQKRSEVTEMIRAQERTEMSRAEELLEQLELEISTLTNRDAEMEKLQPIEDPIDFIQAFKSYVSDSYEEFPEVIFEPQFSFSEMLKSVTPSLREKTKEFHQEIVEVTGFMKGDRVLFKTPESIEKRCEKYNYSTCGYRHYCKVTVGAVGVVSALRGQDSITVNFPDYTGWKGSASKLELVFAMS